MNYVIGCFAWGDPSFEQFPMILALKAAMAHHAGDPGWATVRPPPVALAAEPARALVAGLEARRFAMPGLASR